MEEREHLHLCIEVVHGDVAVLRHHRIQPNHARIGAGQLVADHHLREELLQRNAAVQFVEVANGRIAAGLRVRRAAVEIAPHLRLGIVDNGARGGDDRLHLAALHHRGAHLRLRLAVLFVLHQVARAAEIGGEDRLDVVDVFAGQPPHVFREHLRNVRF